MAAQEAERASPSQWLFSTSALHATPGATNSSIPLNKELYDRARGVEFLYRLGTSLQLPTTALCTAATWFHRFYMRFSLDDFHRQDVAAACIFLATKTEECGRKLRDIAKICQSKIQSLPIDQIPKEDLELCQDTILATEEALLEALCFDFVVDNPHDILVDLFEKNEDEENIQEIAWCIAHDSYRTVVCLLFDVRIIAAACYILAQRVAAGPHSASLDARIAASAPSASLPTPPSNKPTSPDATRFAVDYFRFDEKELKDLAEALTILIEFYSAQDVQGSMSFLAPLALIPPPASHDTSRARIYTPFSHVAPLANSVQDGSQGVDLNDRTPDSSHGGNSPAKTTAGWVPVTGEASKGNAIRGRLDLS